MARNSDVSNLSMQQLEQMLSKRRKEVERLRKRRETLQGRIDNIDEEIAALGGNSAGGGRARNERPLADVIHEVLQERGQAMKVADIADAVQSTGYRSNSANFRGIVNQMLLKDKRFTSPGRSYYQLKK
jgi:hypothetical protein